MATCVLIIEDDKEMSRLLQLDLQRNGYEAATAGNGLEGLRPHNLLPLVSVTSMVPSDSG